MKSGSYFIVLLLAVAGVVLTVALILMAHTNQQLQVQLQAQQQILSQGVLGQQAQQISASVLQDLAGAAAVNPKILQLLEKYGYHVTPARPPAPAGNATPSVAGAVPNVASGPSKSPVSVANQPEKNQQDKSPVSVTNPPIKK